MNRIKPIDGLRAFAVLGVIWAHIWMFFSNVPMVVKGIDVNKLLSFGGIGVDLFFVISGFCMYLMYEKKTRNFNAGVYKEFIVKRWKRIAPAFYFVVIFECFYYLVNHGEFPLKSFLSHLLFINTFDGSNVLSPPFWSLATEWHFYLILPCLFIKDPTGKKLVPRVLILMAVCIIFRLWLYYGQKMTKDETISNVMIWYRFVEFGFGILAARFYLLQKKLPVYLQGSVGFIISLIIAFGGRLCMTTDVCNRFGSAAFIVRSLGEPVLTFGFAVMILNLITSKSIFKKFISANFFLYIGKISYSMYLWHWFISILVSYYIIGKSGISATTMELAFVATLVWLIPVAGLSYYIFESFYFRKDKSVKKYISQSS